MNATEIRDKVDEILRKNLVTYKVRLLGETVRDNEWRCDSWLFTFTPAKGKPYEGDYFTGIGLRAKHFSFKDGKPVHPKAADVLYALTLDAQADSMSFTDWCAQYGYSDDSLKALDTYRVCCATNKKLRAVFSPETLAAIREAVQEL